jgi:hypothetical protein
LVPVEGHREAAEADTLPFSLTLSVISRVAVRLSSAFSARRRSSSAVANGSRGVNLRCRSAAAPCDLDQNPQRKG